MARPKPELVLSDDERRTLTRWANRPKSTQRLALRARIVLACADEPSNKAVAEQLGVCRATVNTWRNRFAARRLDGLTDEPRPGAPRKVTDVVVEQVVTKTLETKPANATHWSTRGMAKASGLSQPGASVHVVLDNYGTHKTPAVKRWFLRHPEYHLHFIPTSSSWLNQVERFFAAITE